MTRSSLRSVAVLALTAGLAVSAQARAAEALLEKLKRAPADAPK